MLVRELLDQLDNNNKSTLMRFQSEFKIEGIGSFYSLDSEVTQTTIEFIMLFSKFLKKYEDDYYPRKSIRYLSEFTGLSEERFKHAFDQKILIGDLALTSSYKIFQRIVGKSYKIDTEKVFQIAKDKGYKQVSLDFKGEDLVIKGTKLKDTYRNSLSEQLALIQSSEMVGYEDVKGFVMESLEPVTDPALSQEFGLQQPGGIIFFGPPGCGKTHWAQWIAKVLGYEFIELPRSEFGSSFVDGAMIGLKKKLDEVIEKEKIVLFFDEFDSVAISRSKDSSSTNEGPKVVNTLLQEIPKLIQRKIILIAASNHLSKLDTAVLRPQRFDLKLPIFPPMIEERASLIVRFLVDGMNIDRKLISILHEEGALREEYWLPYCVDMKLFSVSHVRLFTNYIKRALMRDYRRKDQIEKVALTDQIISDSLQMAKSQISKEDISAYRSFFKELTEAKNTAFEKRMIHLKLDLDSFNGPSRKPIGFNVK